MGHGADLRDTLNRMYDQEQSQQSPSQNRQPVLAPKDQREILVEDLRRAIATTKENDVDTRSKGTRRAQTSSYQGV